MSVLEADASVGGEHRDDPELRFLLGLEGSRRAHSGARLIDHLLGVRSKLSEWNCRRELCSAGLFHSVYGTENFRHQSLSLVERDKVRAVIGDEAEGLVFDFRGLKARSFLEGLADRIPDERPGTDGPVPDRQIDLLHLFTANWIEQFPRMRALQRGSHTNQFRRIRHLLNPHASRELSDIYGFDDDLLVPSRRTVQVDPREPGGPALAVDIVDGLVPNHLGLRLTSLTQRNIWRYGWRAAKTQTTHGFWHSHFAGDNDDGGDASCERELVDRPLVAPVLELWNLIRDTLAPGQVPVRVYANGHTYGGDGHLHTDCDRPGHFTSIYYAHPEWDVNWAGETVFFDSSGQDVLHGVFPKPGRIVHFPGDIPHAARSPSRDCPALRAVIVVKSFDPGNRETN